MSKLTSFILFIFISIVILASISQRHTLSCELISFSDYTEIAPQVFASPSIPSAKYDQLLAYFHSGKGRVDNTFGEMVSRPTVIFTDTIDEASDFGSNAYGHAHLSPLGQCLILGPQGANTDVLAHELTHAEVHFRVGWLDSHLQIPIWFNEGVSLLVDYREPYLMENIKLTHADINAVKQMDASTFFTGDVLKHYQAARVAVDKIEPRQLYQNLAKIRDGEDFKEVF